MDLLTLKLQKANDINLKKYLSNMTKDYKEKYESIKKKKKIWKFVRKK